MPLDATIPLKFDTKTIFDPNQAQIEQQTIRSNQNKLDMQPFEMDAAKLEILKKKNDITIGLLNGVTDQASYDAAKQQAAQYGIPTEHLPPQYDPGTIKQLQMGALSYKDKFDMELKQMNMAEEMRHNRAMENKPSSNTGDFKYENTLRDEFNTLTKDFRTVQDAYSKIKKTSNSGAGDMSMLYQYVKLLDPGSVVRESEFATAAASGSLGERVQGAAKSILQGGRLPESLRREFIHEAENVYQGQRSGYERQKATYKGLAARNNLNPDNVITDYTEVATGEIKPPTPEEEAEYKRLKGMK